MRPVLYVVCVLFLVLVACAPAAPQQPAPAKPAAEVAKPAVEAPKPAAEPAKPAVEAPKPAAEPAKPAVEAPKPAAKPSPIELRAGCSLPKGAIHCNTIDKFAELVEQKTKGTLIVRDFYQALGVEQQLAQSVTTGSVDIGGISNGNAGRFTTAFFVYDLPFLFSKYEKIFESLDGPIGKRAIEQFEKDLGVKLLMPLALGSGRDIFTRNKQVRTPADIKGMKIRVISSPVDLSTFKAWGANPTPVDWAQMYAALQQGVVEGFQPELGALLSGKFYEVVKHGTRLDYQGLFWTFFINQKKFESLSPEHQKAMMEAAAEAKAWNREASKKLLEAVVKELTGLGMTIYTPTSEEYAQWAAIREQVWKDVAEQQKGKIDLNVANELYKTYN